MHWPTALRLALIIDSVVFVLKLSMPIFLIVSGVKEKLWHDQQDKTDSSHLTEVVIFFYLLGGSLLFIFTLLRLLANWSQHRNEEYEENSSQTICANYCVSTFFWFFISVDHIAIDGALIALDWTEGRWKRKVVIGFLCWEILIFCFMVTFKFLFCVCNVSEVSQTDVETAEQETVKN